MILLQATRVVARKGIELAVDLVQALDTSHHRAQLQRSGLYDGRDFEKDNRIVLVLAGYVRDDISGAYVQRLKQKIKQAGIDAVFVGDLHRA